MLTRLAAVGRRQQRHSRALHSQPHQYETGVCLVAVSSRCSINPKWLVWTFNPVIHQRGLWMTVLLCERLLSCQAVARIGAAIESILGDHLRSKSLSYMPALDGLRTVAVLLVFAIHAFPEQSFPGGLGVDIFFLLSGFLITTILLREHVKTGVIKLGRFYAKRLLRLYPPLIIVALAFSAVWVVSKPNPLEGLVYGGMSLMYVSNIAMTFWGVGMGYLSHTWSLSMEEQFYLLWPPMLFAMLAVGWKRSTMAIIVGSLACASLIGWIFTGDELPYNPLTKAGGLLLGALVALLVHDRPWQSHQAAYIGAFVFSVAFLGETAGWISRAWSLPLATVSMIPVMLHLAFGQGVMVRVLSSRGLVHLGAISYAFYLWHYPVLRGLQLVDQLGRPLQAAIGLVLSYALALASMRLVERPVLDWRDRIFRVRESVRV